MLHKHLDLMKTPCSSLIHGLLAMKMYYAKPQSRFPFFGNGLLAALVWTIPGRPTRRSGFFQDRFAWLLPLCFSSMLYHSTTYAQFVPIQLSGGPLVKMVADFQRPYIYAIGGSASGATNGTLLFLNVTNGTLVKTLAIGTNLTDLTINAVENKLYVLSHGDNAVYGVDLNTRTLLSTFSYGTSLSTISGLNLGRFLVGGQGYYYFCNTWTGNPVTTNWISFDGDGEVDSSRSYYYLGSVGSWPPAVLRWQIQGDYLAAGAPALVQQLQYVNGYGSYNLILSHDNSRLFYNGNVYNTNLNNLAWLGAEVFACSSNGALAFTSTQVFDGTSWHFMNNLSVTSSVMAVDGNDQRLWYFNSLANTIESLPLSLLQSPAILQQPTNQTVFSGTPATIGVVASGHSPLTYYWLFNGTFFAVTTNAQVTIANAQPPNIGNYSVVVSNTFGLITSSNAILDVTNSPPILIAQPANQTVLAGTNVIFSITATGSLPMSNQWQYNGTNIALTANGTLILTNIQVIQSGMYSVVVSNQFGIIVSSNSSLSVIPFAISSQPKSQSVQEIAKVSFSVTASGLAPLAYQWQFQGTNLALATNSSLVISNVQRSQAGVFSVMMTNQYGSGISSNTYLTVQGIIVWGSFSYGNSSLTNVPASVTNIIALAAGDQHCLGLRGDGTVVAWGDNSFRQISVPSNLTNVVGIAAGSTHSLALRGDGTIGMWGVISGGGVTNAPANATNIAGLALGPGAQHALALRSDGTVLDWGNSYYGASLTNTPLMARNIVGVAAGSTYALALRSDGRVVQWGTGQFGGSLPSVPTAATNIVAIATGWYGNAGLRADGTVLVWGSIYTPPSSFTNVIDLVCPFNASFSSCNLLALRRNGTLIEYPSAVPAYATNNVSVIAAGSYNGFAAVGSGPPVFPGLPINRTVANCSRAYFRAVAAGAMPISYQWNCNGTNVPGATNVVLVLTNVQPDQAGSSYTLTASNAFGAATSGVMVLNESVLEIYIQPTSQSTLGGGTATFTANVIGQGPFVYQWFLAGTALPSMTNSSLTLTNVQLNQGGAYSLTVSNSYGGVVSSDAILSVIPLAISTQPQSRSAVAGDLVSFSVTPSGQPPFSYQWRFNGNSLADATNSSLVITNVQMDQAGAYTVIVSNLYGSLVSAIASLTVKPLQIVAQPQSHMVYLGSTTTFNVTASNLGPFSYQWQLNGVAIPGATNNPLVLTNLQLAQAGNYSVVVSNLLGAVASSNAVLSISEVAVWGDNSSGQTNLPGGLTNVIAIACGYYHTIALKANGQVVAWGYNSSGQANLPAGLTNLATVGAGGFNNLAVRNDGTMTDWGAPFYGAADVPPGLTNVVAVAGGEYHGLALESDGSVVAWGAGTNDTGSYPNLGQAMLPSGLSNVVAIAAGGSHSMALKRDGTIVAWGDSGAAKTNVPAGLSNIIAIAAGYSHNVALKPDATVLAWGDNTYGQTNVPEGLSNVVAITCGCWNSVALKSDGTIVVWGRNDSYIQTNIPPDLPGVRKIAAGDFHLAALVGNVAVVPMSITCSLTNIHNVSLSFWTQSGRVYAVEYKDELADTDWKTLPLAAGIDGILTLTDPSATHSHRFYRVRQW